MKPVRSYRELLAELLRRRRSGELSQSEEAARAAELDACWNRMTEAEQQRLEHDLSAPDPETEKE